jgi:hypothetical protein
MKASPAPVATQRTSMFNAFRTFPQKAPGPCLW